MGVRPSGFMPLPITLPITSNSNFECLEYNNANNGIV
jgi:hypothetical protein